MNIRELNPWAVILAGGDGTRLQSLTRFISGDARPKQFCPLFGEQTLLGETRARLARLIPAERTLFVVQDAHRPFYEDELAGADPGLILTQPANKGTAVAIAYAVARIQSKEPEATVAIFPADHHYDDDARFLSAVERATAITAREDRFLTLIGVEADSPEVEYGWIEPGASCGEFSRVRRFWEKPPLARAMELLDRNCLWNTFVMVGKARAFADLLRVAAPRLNETAEFIAREGFAHPRAQLMFSALSSIDFSHRILSRSTGKLSVFPLRGVRWSDLGKPERVIATLAEAGIRPHWAAAFSTLTNKATA